MFCISYSHTHFTLPTEDSPRLLSRWWTLSEVLPRSGVHMKKVFFLLLGSDDEKVLSSWDGAQQRRLKCETGCLCVVWGISMGWRPGVLGKTRHDPTSLEGFMEPKVRPQGGTLVPKPPCSRNMLFAYKSQGSRELHALVVSSPGNAETDLEDTACENNSAYDKWCG
jgi:hypothetical protein